MIYYKKLPMLESVLFLFPSQAAVLMEQERQQEMSKLAPSVPRAAPDLGPRPQGLPRGKSLCIREGTLAHLCKEGKQRQAVLPESFREEECQTSLTLCHSHTLWLGIHSHLIVFQGTAYYMVSWEGSPESFFLFFFLSYL